MSAFQHQITPAHTLTSRLVIVKIKKSLQTMRKNNINRELLEKKFFPPKATCFYIVMILRGPSLDNTLD